MIENHQPKSIVITGATSGIGLALMENLAAKGHRLIGLGRSPTRCQEQDARLREMHPDLQVRYLVADLSRQLEIRNARDEIASILDAWGQTGLDALINNAGTFTFWQTLTRDGFETQWAVNHLAPFLLTNLLLPLLETGQDPRVITVSSGSHYNTRLKWHDLQGLGRYNPLQAYKQTKLANVVFTAEFNRRQGQDPKVRAYAADPGLVNTGIGAKNSSQLASRIWSRRRKRGQSPEKSAAGIIQLLEEDLPESGAIYWKHGRPKKPNPFALDRDHGWRLWEVSARMTGIA